MPPQDPQNQQLKQLPHASQVDFSQYKPLPDHPAAVPPQSQQLPGVAMPIPGRTPGEDGFQIYRPGVPVPTPTDTPQAGALSSPGIEKGIESSMPTGGMNQGMKKQLLHKLMSNLLSKPGRSMHEVINGVKDAIGAYKNYAREWDNLNQATGGSPAAAGTGSPASGSIDSILQGIQSKKHDGGGGPGFAYGKAMMNPSVAQPYKAAPHTVQDLKTPPHPSFPATPSSPTIGPAHPPAAIQANNNPAPTPITPMPVQAPNQIQRQNPKPMIAPMAPIAGQAQTSNFNRPAPVSSLGIFGY